MCLVFSFRRFFKTFLLFLLGCWAMSLVALFCWLCFLLRCLLCGWFGGFLGVGLSFLGWAVCAFVGVVKYFKTAHGLK